MRIFFLLFLVITCAAQAKAQKQVATGGQVWMGYINQMRVADKWSVTADAHIRTKDHFFNNFSTGVLRTGAIYHVNENVTASAGYAYFHYYPADDHSGVAQPEHRPYQQVQWITRYSKLRLQQRLRLEERFRRKIKDADELGEGYSFNYRARCQLMLQVPFSKKGLVAKTLSSYVGDEILLNFGKQIVNNTLDHNRIHAGLNYQVDADDQLQVGYMNIFQQQSSGSRYRMIHVIRIYYHHAIDFRKKQ